MRNNVLRVIKTTFPAALLFLAVACSDTTEIGDTTTPIIITEVTIANNDLITVQPQIKETSRGTEIVFSMVGEATDEQKKVALTFDVPEGCIAEPASGEVVDFSKGEVVYLITNTTTKYSTKYIAKCEQGEYQDAFITKIEIKHTKVTVQPLEEDGNFVFHVAPTITDNELKTAFKPVVTISEGATIDYQSGVVRDFLNDTRSVKYTVTSQSGESKEYTLTCIRDKYKIATILSVSSIDPMMVTQPTLGGVDIVLYVSKEATADQIAAMQLNCVLSPGATLQTLPLALNTPVEYIVTSEDEVTQGTYTVTVKDRLLYDFEKWYNVPGTIKRPDREEPNGWATANDGVGIMYTMSGYTGLFCVQPNENGASGRGLEMITRDTGSGVSSIPKVTSGSAFFGTFKTNIFTPLKSSQFGIEFHGKPLTVKGVYKYKAGDEYHKNKDGIDPNIKDKMAITVVLYEVNDYSETITAHQNELNTSTKLIARAYMENGDEKSEYTPFELNLGYGLNGKTYDPTKKYKFSIVFSSSFDGTNYYGAPGSSLMVDEVEVICE